ncbi:MAG: NosD domain-containing protein [Phycisphaerae bacterium]|nr:NosD domain-containing protein [Phycisphaerae bacterium]
MRGLLLFVVVFVAALGHAVHPTFADVVPTNGMVITTDTTFVPGTYSLPDGISIGASDLDLDMNGAVLVGAGGAAYGITCIGHSNVTITGGGLHGYYYGIRVETGDAVTIANCNLSDNYVDPASRGGGAPFLNINAGPTLPNFTNLGGGLYMRTVSGAVITNNVMRNQENGIDLYSVTNSTISGNDGSFNTGWGLHLNASTGNDINGNVFDHCTRPGLGDSAGVLLVNGSHNNQIIKNSFRFSGDGFFIGNEHGCPSNNNLVQGNDGSAAGANAFEATFSSGNQFIDNIANGSNYGFWLGYSHSGNVIKGNEIRANNTNGIEIEHGQNNIIEDNLIANNGGKGIVLRTDGSAPFPPAQFPCLALPNQAASTGYTIRDNVIKQNFGLGIELINTTDSVIVNNLIGANAGGDAKSSGAGNTWAIVPVAGVNIVGGPMLGGNYWSGYAGADLDADGLGDTLVPYTNGGMIALPGDPHPLIGDPDLTGFDNPKTLCARVWIDLGVNTRTTGGTFQTANGTHYATDGTDLYLLRGSNNALFDLFLPDTSMYLARANVPEPVEDGGDLQFGGAEYFAGVGISMNTATGSGKGPKLYAYSPRGNSWSSKASCVIEGKFLAHEALAHDPVQQRLYATITNVQNGTDPLTKRRLAVYDIVANVWTGTTAAADVDWVAGSEAEYLNGRIYVWRGGFDGGAVNGSDSYLHVYDISTDIWTVTPSLQASGVLPGFRSGAFDVWGVALTADAAREGLFVLGGESNKLVYVFNTLSQSWRVAPTAVYDGGWGDSLEFVAGAQRLYQIDGRNIGGTPQGTAVLVTANANLDGTGGVNAADLAVLLGAWGQCADACCLADLDENGTVDAADLALLLGAWTG